MSIVSVPPVTLNIKSSQKEIEDAPQSILFVGQKTAAGSAPAGALTINVGITGQEDALFGEKSFLTAGIRAFRRINQLSRVDAIVLDDNGAGVAATATITATGTATDTGTVEVSVQSGFFASVNFMGILKIMNTFSTRNSL